jgi:hypothetical protein
VRIDKNLNLVIPLDSDTHGRLYVYSTPISRDIFKTHYRVFARTYAQLQADGVTVAAGPGVARLALESVAREMGKAPDGVWPEVEREVVNEIIRLTNIAIAGKDGGYDQMPLSTAYARGIFDAEYREHIEGKITFFTLEGQIHPRPLAMSMLSFVGGMWGFLITSSSFTEFLNSLPTSTLDGSTGETCETAPAAPVARLASVPR